MKHNRFSYAKSVGILFLMLLVILPVQAQFLRTSYFMDGAVNRVQLNPALQPTKGYFNIPLVGAFNLSASSDVLGMQDIYDIIDENDDFLTNEKLFQNLKVDNQLNVSLNTDILSFGFYKGKSFWTFNVGLRADVDASIPKTMFEYMRDTEEDFSWDNADYDIRGQKMNVNAYTEVGLGYSRTINDRLTVGAKLKFLAGVGNLNLNVNQIAISGHEDGINSRYTIKTDAHLESSFKGMDLTNNEDGTIDDLEFDNYGIAGYGGAIDLGATYRIFKGLTVSAAILDLGFISWSKDATVTAVANRDVVYDQDSYDEFTQLTEGGDILLDFDLLGLREEEGKAHTTNLTSTLVLGAEYGLLNNKVGFGVLYTSRFGKLRTMSELTLSANLRPKNWFNATVSYSMIQSLGKSFGVALKLGPLMVGTDYMFFGSNTKSANAYLGISIPMGGKKRATKINSEG